MRKVILPFVILLFVAPPRAAAQQFQGLQIFGGYSYLRENIGSTFSPFFFPPTRFGDNFPLNGWQASVTETATDWFGLTQEFGGFYGTHRLNGFDNHFKTFSILTGPRFSYPNLKVITPFAHALFGYDQTTVNLRGVNFSATSQSYAMALGGGLDIKVSRRLAIRLLQADYFRTQVFGGSQNNVRYSAGVIFRFGK